MSNYNSINSKFPSAQKAIIEAFQEDVDQQEALPSVFLNTNLPAKAALPVTTDKRTLKNYRTEAQKAADARKRFEKFAREDNRNGESPSLYIVNITVNNFYFGARAPAQDGSYAAPATAMAPAGYYATPTPVMAPTGYYAAPAQAMVPAGYYAAPAQAMVPAGYYAAPAQAMAPAGYYAAPAQAMAPAGYYAASPSYGPSWLLCSTSPSYGPSWLLCGTCSSPCNIFCRAYFRIYR